MPVYAFQLSSHLAGRAVSVSATGSDSVVASGTLDESASFSVSLPVGDYVASAGTGQYVYRAAGVVDQGDLDRLADSALSSTLVARLEPASYTYNPDGTVATETAGGKTTSYTYNPDGTVKTASRDGVTLTYSYNADGTVAGVA